MAHRSLTSAFLILAALTALMVVPGYAGPLAHSAPQPAELNPEDTGVVEGGNDANVSVPNDLNCQQFAASPITLNVPGDGLVTAVEYSARIATTGYTSDLLVSLEHEGVLTVWDFLGDYTGGDDNMDDDPENDQDVDLRGRGTAFFDDQLVNGEWRLTARNCSMVGSAYIDRWSIRVWYTTEADISVTPNQVYYSYTVAGEEAQTWISGYDAVAAELAEQDSAQVVVLLDERSEAAAFRAAPGIEVIREYTIINGFSAALDGAALAALAESPGVLGVWPDVRVHAMLEQGVPLINADDAWALGYTGEGVTVAVLDTGVDSDHPDIADDLGPYQYCAISFGGCPPDNTKESNSAEDGAGHGTSVAGIITSRGSVAPRGVAPDAEIVAVKVLSDDGWGDLSDVIYAIDWIIRHNDVLGVDIINMSLGGGGHYSSACDSAFPPLGQAISAAHDAGIAVFAASGNEHSLTGVAMPGCFRDAIAVGAVYDADVGAQQYAPLCEDTSTQADKVICYSNTGPNLDLLAPSYRNKTTALGGGIERYFSGTSAASPYAAAVGALFKQRYPEAQPDYLLERLKASGEPIVDHRTGRVFPRVDAYAAITETGFTIANNGASDLHVTAISYQPDCWLALDIPGLPLAIPSGQFVQIGALFHQCTGQGVYSAVITVQSDDPDEPSLAVPVTLEVFGELEPPALDVDVFLPLLVKGQS